MAKTENVKIARRIITKSLRVLDGSLTELREKDADLDALDTVHGMVAGYLKTMTVLLNIDDGFEAKEETKP